MEKLKNKSGIYCIINKINNKIYVGSSINLKNRYNGHIRDLKNKRHHSILLQRAVDKYGLINFKFKVLEFTNTTNIIEREQYWMDYYESYNPNKGYNISPTAGNTLGRKLRIETKEKIRNALKGSKLTKERRLNISNSMKNISFSENHRKNLSKSLKGNKLSEEHKKNISKAKTISMEVCFRAKDMLLDKTNENWTEKENRIAKELKTSNMFIRNIRYGKHIYSKDIGGSYKEWLLEE